MDDDDTARVDEIEARLAKVKGSIEAVTLAITSMHGTATFDPQERAALRAKIAEAAKLPTMPGPSGAAEEAGDPDDPAPPAMRGAGPYCSMVGH